MLLSLSRQTKISNPPAANVPVKEKQGTRSALAKSVINTCERGKF